MKKLPLLSLLLICIQLFSQKNHNYTAQNNHNQNITTKHINKELSSLKQLKVLNNNPFGIAQSIWIQYFNNRK
jgi:hypothetical protein